MNVMDEGEGVVEVEDWEDTSGLKALLEGRVKQLAARPPKPHSKHRVKRDTRAAARAAFRGEMHGSLSAAATMEDVDLPHFQPYRDEWKRNAAYRSVNLERRRQTGRVAKSQATAGVVLAHALGVHPEEDTYPCGIDSLGTATCADKTTDYDVLYPDPLLLIKHHYEKKLGLEKARAKCTEFVPFKCIACDKAACARHQTGRACPQCGDPTLCSECVGVLRHVLLAESLTQYFLLGLPGHFEPMTPALLEVRKSARRDFQARVDALARCKAHQQPTPGGPPNKALCCGAPVFTCARCSRADACSVHEAGRVCPTCKTHTVCGPCGKKDRDATQLERNKLRAQFAREKESVKAWPTRDVTKQTEAVDFTMPGPPTRSHFSKKSMQTKNRHELGNVQARFRRSAMCSKHK